MWVLVVLAVIAFTAVWWLVFRAAMRSPNNGNEFSSDSEGGERL
jgi:hypothetical protein